MKKTFIAVSSLVLGAGALLMTAPSVMAYRGDPNVQGPSCTPERHEEMVQAFDNNDYNAWKDLMQGRGRVSQVINEENFARFAEAHKLRMEGKIEEANEIRAELGLGLNNGLGKGQGQGFGRQSQ